jgi:hypothetical protein
MLLVIEDFWKMEFEVAEPMEQSVGFLLENFQGIATFNTCYTGRRRLW